MKYFKKVFAAVCTVWEIICGVFGITIICIAFWLLNKFVKRGCTTWDDVLEELELDKKYGFHRTN